MTVSPHPHPFLLLLLLLLSLSLVGSQSDPVKFVLSALSFSLLASFQMYRYNRS